MKKQDAAIPTKSLKISEPVHTKLKIHIAKTKGNMTKFSDAAILAKLKQESK
jgi:hypothetical protein